MRRMLGNVAAGVSLCLIWPMLAAAGERQVGGTIEFQPKEHVKNFTHVELIGKVTKEWESFLRLAHDQTGATGTWRYTMTVAGKTYDLVADSRFMSRLLAQLEGKQVRVSGRLEERFICPCCVGAGNRRVGHLYMVHVDSIEEYQHQSVRQIAKIEVRGTLDTINVVERFPNGTFFVTVNGRTFTLDFGDRVLLSIGAMVGQNVVIVGQLNQPGGNVICVESIRIAN